MLENRESIDKDVEMCRRWVSLWSVVCIHLLSGMAAENCQGAEDSVAEVESPPAISKAIVSRALQELESDQKLDSNEKASAIKLLQSALIDCDDLAPIEQRKQRFQHQLDTAVRELDSLRKKLTTLPEQPVPTPLENMDAEHLARQRDELNQRLDDTDHGLRGRVANLEQEFERRIARLEAIADETSTAEENLTTSTAELEKLSADSETPIIAAQRLALLTAEQRWQQELSALKAERAWLLSADADRWIRLKQQIAEREIALVEAELEQVNERLDQQRRREASERVEQAKQELEALPPALQNWARENQELAERSRKLTERLGEVADERESADEELTSLKEDAEQIHKVAESLGRNDSLGLMLKRQMSRLPSRKALERRIAKRMEENQVIRLKLFELELQERQTPEVDTILASAKSFAQMTDDGFDEVTLRGQIEKVLERREERIDQLKSDYRELQNELMALDETEQKTVLLAQQTAEFCDAQRLWLRGSTMWGIRDVLNWRETSGWLRDSAAWQDVPEILLQDIERRPVLYLILAVAGWATLLVRMPKPNMPDQRFSLSLVLSSTVAVAVRSAFLPGVLAFIAWRLERTAEDSAWCQAVAHGLWRCSVVIWPLLIVRRCCAADGLGEFQLNWPRNVTRRISRRVTCFLPVAIGLLFVVGTTESLRNDVISESLGRTAFLGFMIVTGFFCRSLVRVAGTSLGTVSAVDHISELGNCADSMGTRGHRVHWVLRYGPSFDLAT